MSKGNNKMNPKSFLEFFKTRQDNPQTSFTNHFKPPDRMGHYQRWPQLKLENVWERDKSVKEKTQFFQLSEKIEKTTDKVNDDEGSEKVGN